MADLMTEEEFTEHFTDLIRDYNLQPSCKEPLILDLHYGADEPVLTLSLREVFSRYREAPDLLSDFLQPYIQDLGWTIAPPRYPSKVLYERSLPLLRNLVLEPFLDEEQSGVGSSLKGPVVFEEICKAAGEQIVMQFNLVDGGLCSPLRKGDTLPCIPDAALHRNLSLHNLALRAEESGITATPLQFSELKLRAWSIGLADEKLQFSIAALSCIPQVMSSLEQTLRGSSVLLAVMPSSDQLIISVDTDEESRVQLGLLASQLIKTAPHPLSSLLWSYRDGNLESVQILDLQQQGD